MSVFISDKDTAKLYVHVLDQNNLKSKYLCKNDSIYIRDFEFVLFKKTRSRVLSGLKTLGFALRIHSCSFFKQYVATFIKIQTIRTSTNGEKH